MRREGRGLVRDLSVSNRPARLLLARGPILRDARLPVLGRRAGVRVLGADVRVSLFAGHDLKLDPLDRVAPAR
jgi:hypothetical protein